MCLEILFDIFHAIGIIFYVSRLFEQIYIVMFHIRKKYFLRPKGFRYNHAEPLVLYGLSTMCVPILLLYVQYNLHPDTPLSESENMMPHTMLKSSQGKL